MNSPPAGKDKFSTRNPKVNAKDHIVVQNIWSAPGLIFLAKYHHIKLWAKTIKIRAEAPIYRVNKAWENRT